MDREYLAPDAKENADPGKPEKNEVLGGQLYLVATPIGNLSDLSPRALKVLEKVDVIAAEDTRTAAKLLSLYGIRGKSMLPYHKHNYRSAGASVLQKMQSGLSVALVSDAGTPAVSDPGEDLVRLCAERGLPVTALPGCCAAVAALALSGLSTERFAFEGFLPPPGGRRTRRLESLRREERTMIFYCSPHKLREDLADLLRTLGDRRAALCRELTKRNEEILRVPLSAAASLYESALPRGEFVLVVEGCPDGGGRTADGDGERAGDEFPASPAAHLEIYLAKGLSRMDAMKAAAKERGISKSDFYALLLKEEQKSL